MKVIINGVSVLCFQILEVYLAFVNHSQRLFTHLPQVSLSGTHTSYTHSHRVSQYFLYPKSSHSNQRPPPAAQSLLKLFRPTNPKTFTLLCLVFPAEVPAMALTLCLPLTPASASSPKPDASHVALCVVTGTLPLGNGK